MKKRLIGLKGELIQFWGKAKQTDPRLVIGASVLILVSVLYWGSIFRIRGSACWTRGAWQWPEGRLNGSVSRMW